MNDSPEAVLLSLAKAWMSGDSARVGAEIGGLYSDDAVVVASDGERVAKGRDDIVASYEAFAREARIVASDVSDPVVDRFGDLAIGTVAWMMTYEIDGNRSAEVGQDVYVLRENGGQWRIVWRQLMSRPA